MKKRYLIRAIVRDKKGRVLSVGWNNYEKTHPKQKHFAVLAGQPYKEYLHAEVAALINIPNGVKPDNITIERFKHDRPLRKDPGPTYPCPVCKKAIEAYGITKVICG